MVELEHSARKQPRFKSHIQENANVISIDASCSNKPLDRTRLEEILGNIPLAIVVFDKPKGTVVYANKRAIELHGKNPCGIPMEKQAHDLKIYSMTGRICRTKELYTYRALFNGETFRDQPVIIERQDGKRFIISVNVKPLYDSEGKINGAIAIYDDVTERMKTQKALMESEERLKTAQRIAHMGSWEYHVKEDRAFWSDELFHIFGLPVQEYGPNSTEYFSIIHPDDREAINKAMALQTTGHLYSKASFDYRIQRPDSSVRVIHTERMVSEVDEKQNATVIAGIEQDITERKQIEQKLEKYAKNLEQLVEERTIQLKNAERLAAIGQTAGMIGHDIRNPLQAIAGELYLMKQDVDASPDNKCKHNVQESLASIQEQIDYMNKIIADLQDYARQLIPEKVETDLQTTIPQLVTTVRIPKNIELKTECDRNVPKIKVDLTFLKRILVNLATNAVQAMPNGGKLTLKTTQQGDKIIIAVADTGVGIPEDMKPKIFQPLMTTKAKGQGFGLAVVKRLVEAMDGSITFESKLGEGTQFILTFPTQSSDPA
jgi:PAS domain S-box-containing protein